MPPTRIGWARTVECAKSELMKLGLALVLLSALLGCPNATGSSPSVPKKAIERAADTKIPDAGADAGDAGPSSAESH